MRFEDKTVLVTGGTAGIGRASAERFAAEGATVIVAGRDGRRGAETVAAIEDAGGRSRYLAADLSRPGTAEQLAAEAGPVDVLVNNTGVSTFGPTHETSRQQLQTLLDVNVLSTFALVAELVPGMVSRGGGAIVNVSTMAASVGLAGMAAYGASKAAVDQLTRSWAAEYGPQGVRVNAVAPGPTRTPGTEPMGDALDQLAATLPLGRAADPDEIAGAIVFVASDEAGYMNGAIVAVDGGRAAV